jgi:methyl-accepting chemotaxis protein
LIDEDESTTNSSSAQGNLAFATAESSSSSSSPQPVRRPGLLALLLALSLVMMVCAVGIFAMLLERQHAADRNERASAIWAIYQFEKEGKKLRAAIDAALLDRVTADRKKVMQRVDVLYSAGTVLNNIDLNQRFRFEPKAGELAERALGQLAALVRTVDALPRDGDLIRALESLRPQVIALDETSEEMLLLCYVSDAHLMDEGNRATDFLYVVLGIVFAAMTVSLVSMLVLLVRQIKRNAEDWELLEASRREVIEKSMQLSDQEQRERFLRQEADLKRAADARNAELQISLDRLAGMISAVSQQCENMGDATALARQGSRAAADSTRRAAEHVAGVAGSAEEVSVAGHDIARKTAQNTARSQGVETRTARTDVAVKELQRAMDQIDSVARLIEQVAGHTNLLALNATIEAARAGEAGRGFAVVASEIKSLAAQTKDATSEIGRQIQATKVASAYCIETMDEIRSATVEMIADSEDVTGIVESQSLSVTEVARMIRSAAREANSASELGNTVMTAAEMANVSAEAVLKLVRDMHAESQKISLVLNG